MDRTEAVANAGAEERERVSTEDRLGESEDALAERLRKLSSEGRVDEALRQFAAARPPEPQALPRRDLLHAELLFAARSFEAARDTCREHTRRGGSRCSGRELAAFFLWQGRCSQSLEDKREAEWEMVFSAGLYRHVGDIRCEAGALRWLARLHWETGSKRQALDALRRVRDAYRHLGLVAEEVEAGLELSRACARAAEPVEARSAWVEARRGAGELGDGRLDEMVRRGEALIEGRLGHAEHARRLLDNIAPTEPSEVSFVVEVLLDAGCDGSEVIATLSRTREAHPGESDRLLRYHAEALWMASGPDETRALLHGATPDQDSLRTEDRVVLDALTVLCGDQPFGARLRAVSDRLRDLHDPIVQGRIVLRACELHVRTTPGRHASDLGVPELQDMRDVLLEVRSGLRRTGRADLLSRLDKLLEDCWLACPWSVELEEEPPENTAPPGTGRPSGHYRRHRRAGSREIVTRDARLLAVLESLDLIGPSDLPILIIGESGTGKELVARAIHKVSARREKPFVPINCGAIPAELQESELFGHLRGAFTGSLSDKIGLFEQAHGGTVFLDEIGEIDPQAQVKLLRILESGELRRLGETRLRTVDVRIVAATNADLERQLEVGRFRRDLYYRVRGYQIDLPPLRDRPGDVLLLAEHFLRQGSPSEEETPRLTQSARRALVEHVWPGNVRELRHVIGRGLAHGRLTGAAELTEVMLGLGAPSEADDSSWKSPLEVSLPLEKPLDECLEDHERHIILQALEENGWNRTRAAKSLGGISRTTLIGKMKRLGLFTDSRAEGAG